MHNVNVLYYLLIQTHTRPRVSKKTNLNRFRARDTPTTHRRRRDPWNA